MFSYISALLSLLTLFILVINGYKDVSILIVIFGCYFVNFLDLEQEGQREGSLFTSSDLGMKIYEFFQNYGLEKFVLSISGFVFINLILSPLILIVNFDSWFYLVVLNLIVILFNLLYQQGIQLFAIPGINDQDPKSYNFFNFFKNIGSLIIPDSSGFDRVKIFDLGLDRGSNTEKWLLFYPSMVAIPLLVWFYRGDIFPYIKDIKLFSSNLVILLGLLFGIVSYIYNLFIKEESPFSSIINNIKEENYAFLEWDYEPLYKLLEPSFFSMMVLTVFFIINVLLNASQFLLVFNDFLQFIVNIKETLFSLSFKDLILKLFSHYKIL